MTQQGQTIVIILFVAAVALAIGVGTSNRLISILRSRTESYTSYRATAVAEAALERILVRDYSELADFITFNSCGSECLLQIVNDDGLIETATITLSFLGNSSEPFMTRATTDDVSEVALTGYANDTPLTLCWNGAALDPDPSVVGYLLYGNTGSYEINSFAYNSFGSTYTNGFSTTSGGNGYDSCFSINSQTTPQLLRVRSLYSDVDIVVIPNANAILPIQGILLQSFGTVLDTSQQVNAIKGANVVPLPFDYVLHSQDDSNPLSN